MGSNLDFPQRKDKPFRCGKSCGGAARFASAVNHDAGTSCPQLWLLSGRIGALPQVGHSFGGNTVRIMPLRRAAGVAVIAGAVMLLAPAPAHAEFVCWMSDGVRYCYDDQDGKVPPEPEPAPVEEPPFVPAPLPAPVVQPPARPVPAPAGPVPAPAPVSATPVTVLPQQNGYIPPANAPAPAAEGPAAPAPAAPRPSATKPAVPAAAKTVDTAAVPTTAASPTAAGSPPTSASVVAAAASEPASDNDAFPVLAIAVAGGGVLAAAAVALSMAPVRSRLGTHLDRDRDGIGCDK